MAYFQPESQLPDLNTLSDVEKQSLTRDIYTKPGYFSTLFQTNHIEIECAAFSNRFRAEIERLLHEKNIAPHCTQLETLHEHLSDEMRAYNFDDGVNKISTYFYETDKQFTQLYYQFIQFLRNTLLLEPFWFQATPTIRIHCPNAKNSHHYPRYHTDIGYGHPPEEMNLWMPLTHLLDRHGFRRMSVAQSQQILEKFDYQFDAFIDQAIHNKTFSSHCDALSQPVSTPFGSLLAFDARCIHTGEPLRSHTRISIDIRITPISQFEKRAVNYQGLGRRRVLFQPGHCYHPVNSENLGKELFYE